MPVFVDKNGTPRQVHKGYEGTKYREVGTLAAPFAWRRWAVGILGGLGLAYAYLSVTAMLEESAAQVIREERRAKLEEMRVQDPLIFNEALSRGLVRVSGSAPVETPIDMREVLKRAFPEDFATLQATTEAFPDTKKES